MTDPLSLPNIQAALERSGLRPLSSDVYERLTSACKHPEIEPGGILEITRANWGTEQQRADDVLVVQTRAALFLILRIKGKLLRRDEMARLRCRYDWYQDLIEDDEMAGPSVFFAAQPGHHDFLLSFPTTRERDRMFSCLFEAHRGRLSRWGL